MYRNKCKPFKPENKYTILCKSESLYNSCKDTYKHFASIEESLAEYLEEKMHFEMQSADISLYYRSSKTYKSEFEILLKQIDSIENKLTTTRTGKNTRRDMSEKLFYVVDNFIQKIKIPGQQVDDISVGQGVTQEVYFKALYYLVKKRWLIFYRINDEKIYTISDRLDKENFKNVCLILVHSINYLLFLRKQLPFKISLAVIIPFLFDLSDTKQKGIKARLLKYYINYNDKHMFCKNDIKTLKDLLACDEGKPHEIAKCFQDSGIGTALPCAISIEGNLDYDNLQTMYYCGFQLRNNLSLFEHETHSRKIISLKNNVDKIASVLYKIISPPSINRSLIWETFETLIISVGHISMEINYLPKKAKFIVKCFELLIKDYDGKIITDFKHGADEDLGRKYKKFIKKLFYFWTSSPIPSEECELVINENLNNQIMAHTCTKTLELPLRMSLNELDINASVRTLYNSFQAVVQNVLLEDMNIE